MTSKRSWKLQEFVGHSSTVTSAALGHKSGRVMATGGEDGKVNMWHVGSPNCIMSLSPLPNAVEAVHFNASEELICAGSRSGALRIWDLAASKVVRQLTGHKAAVRSLDFHPYGDFVVSGAVDHKVRMWDIRRKGCIFTYKGHEGQVNGVEFSPDGRWISSVSDDKTCKIWNITAGKLLHELRDHLAPISCLQFHPNEFLLATGSCDRTSIVYDVEKIQVVSRSGVEANPIQHIMFDDSGKYLYTASQDCCKIYAWENTFSRLDTVLVKWGKPADITIAAEQLMGCSYTQNVVSVHIIDTTQLQKIPGNEIEEHMVKDPPDLRMPSSQHPISTARAQTSLGVANPPRIAEKVHCNNNNADVRYQNIDTDDESQIFKPTATLARSPEKNSRSTNTENKSNGSEAKSLESRHPAKTGGNSVHPPAASGVERRLAANLGPALPNNAGSAKPSNAEPKRTSSADPKRPSSGDPKRASSSKPTRPNNVDSRRPSKPEPLKEAAKPSEKDDKDVGDLQKRLAAADVKNKREPLGGALQWGNSKHVPTRDRNFPEKPAACVSNPSLPDHSALVPIFPQSSLSLSTVVPNERQDPIGLDMNAFLPAKRDLAPASSTARNDGEAISYIRKGLDTMRLILTSRHKNLEIVRALWTSGDVMTSINTAVKMEDQALIVDLLNVLTLKPALWNLDLCVVMLSQIRGLIESKHESYTSVGCQSLKLVLKNFAQVIRSNLKPPPHAVDISREERHKKCKSCYTELRRIESVLESKQQTSGKIGSQFRELKILISTLE